MERSTWLKEKRSTTEAR